MNVHKVNENHQISLLDESQTNSRDYSFTLEAETEASPYFSVSTYWMKICCEWKPYYTTLAVSFAGRLVQMVTTAQDGVAGGLQRGQMAEPRRSCRLGANVGKCSRWSAQYGGRGDPLEAELQPFEGSFFKPEWRGSCSTVTAFSDDKGFIRIWLAGWKLLEMKIQIHLFPCHKTGPFILKSNQQLLDHSSSLSHCNWFWLTGNQFVAVVVAELRFSWFSAGSSSYCQRSTWNTWTQPSSVSAFLSFYLRPLSFLNGAHVSITGLLLSEIRLIPIFGDSKSQYSDAGGTFSLSDTHVDIYSARLKKA